MILDRRHFFKGLLALPVVGKLMAKRVANPPPVVPVPTPKPQLVGFDEHGLIGASGPIPMYGSITISTWGNCATLTILGNTVFGYSGLPLALKPPAPEDYKNPYWKDAT